MIPRVLILNPFGIGDVIFTTPIIEAIKREYPKGYIGYICNIRTAPIILSNPNIDRFFIFEKDEYRHLWSISKRRCIGKLYSLLKDIKKEEFDTVFDLSLAQEYGFFLQLAGITRRIGYNYRNRGIFLTDKLKLGSAYHKMHVIDYYKKLLDLAGIKSTEDLKPRIYMPEEAIRKAEEILSLKGITENKSFVCIFPGGGASWGSTSFRKQWPRENFLELARTLCGKEGQKVVLLGSGEDKTICEYINEKEKECINICGETDLLTSVAIIAKARLLVTNDGGPLHMATAVGTDTVSIFGPVDEKVYGPYPKNGRHIVVKNDTLDCRPCYRNFKIPECKHRNCLDGIKVSDVMEAVRRKISSPL